MITFLLLYLCSVFISVQPDITQWEEFGRFIFIVIYISIKAITISSYFFEAKGSFRKNIFIQIIVCLI